MIKPNLHIGMYQYNFNIAGGMPKQILRVAEELKSFNIETTLLTNKYFQIVNSKLNFDIIEVNKINSLKKIIRERNIDLINIHTGYSGILISIWISSKLNLPIIPTIHTQRRKINYYFNLSMKDILNSPKREIGLNTFSSSILHPKIVNKLIDYSKIPTFSTISKRIQNSLTTKIKSFWIPPGVNINKFKPEKGAKDKDDFIILFFGRALINRGIDIVIKAFENISKYNSNFILHLILLPDRNSEKIRKMVRISPFSDRIYLTDKYVMNLPERINNSDIVVFPIRSICSIPEYPLTIIEAMACQKPIITSNIGGIPEFIFPNKNGIVLSKNTPKELANEIIYLYENPDKAKSISRNAMQYVVKNHNWKKISIDTLDMYRYGIENYDKK